MTPLTFLKLAVAFCACASEASARSGACAFEHQHDVDRNSSVTAQQRRQQTTVLARLCEQARGPFDNVTAPEKPSETLEPGDLITNVPVANPCSSLFELLYAMGLYSAAHVYRIGLGRSSTMLFDPFTSITLLAPSDAAFRAINITEDSVPDETWRSLAEAHLLPGAISSKDVACSKRGGSFTLDVESWAAETLTMRIGVESVLKTIARASRSPSPSSPNSASNGTIVNVVRADVPGCYSVLHVVDRVMLARD